MAIKSIKIGESTYNIDAVYASGTAQSIAGAKTFSASVQIASLNSTSVAAGTTGWLIFKSYTNTTASDTNGKSGGLMWIAKNGSPAVPECSLSWTGNSIFVASTNSNYLGHVLVSNEISNFDVYMSNVDSFITAAKNTVKQTASTSGTHYLLFGPSSPTSGNQYQTYYSSGSSGIYATPSNNYLYAGAFYETSDETLKNFGDDIPIDFEKLAKLKKKYFTWKEGEDKSVQIGVSAQEIREIYPEIVSENEDTGTLSVAYDRLAVVALAAVDKLNEKIKSLEDRLAKIESVLEKINVNE